jgi:hypothetical protein
MKTQSKTKKEYSIEDIKEFRDKQIKKLSSENVKLRVWCGYKYLDSENMILNSLKMYNRYIKKELRKLKTKGGFMNG